MTEKLRHETKSWLSNPGNMITLVLAVISISSAIYNAAASMSVEMTEVRTLTRNNAEQVEELAVKLEQMVTLVNRHVQWSEGRSANVDELMRRVERLERQVEGRR